MCLGKQAQYKGNPAPYALDQSQTAVTKTVTDAPPEDQKPKSATPTPLEM